MIDAIKTIALLISVAQTWPSYAPQLSRVAIEAVRVATPEVSAELLTAIAYYESRGDVTAVSRVKRANGSTALFCGVTQATATSEADCVALRDVSTALRRTVDELGKWEAMCVRLHAGNPGAAVRFDECALAGYAEGMAGAKRGSNRDARRKLKSEKSLKGETWKR